MQHTREEIAHLLKKSKETRRKTAEIYRQLQVLMRSIDRTLWKQLPPQRRIRR